MEQFVNFSFDLEYVKKRGRYSKTESKRIQKSRVVDPDPD
jgi:hypothetical protein